MEQPKLPLAFVVALHATPPAQETVTSSEAAYPVPSKVIVAPTGPGPAETDRREETVNDVGPGCRNRPWR